LNQAAPELHAIVRFEKRGAAQVRATNRSRSRDTSQKARFTAKQTTFPLSATRRTDE